VSEQPITPAQVEAALAGWEAEQGVSLGFTRLDCFPSAARAEQLRTALVAWLAERLAPPVRPDRPRTVALCGSTRFRAAYEQARYAEEHAGRIVLGVPCYKDDPCCKTAEAHARLAKLHLAKFDLADEILVIDGERPWCPTCQQHCPATGGSKSECHGVPIEWRPYVGDSARREIAYAEAHGKRVRYLSEENGGEWCGDCAGRGRWDCGGAPVVCCHCDGTGRRAAKGGVNVP
jgi:hypothetical protein